jgi:hypothetical protein
MESAMLSPTSRLSKWLFKAVLILNSGIALSYIGLWVMTAYHGQLWRADFSAFYTGWVMVRDGKGSQLYDLDLEKQYQLDILGGRSFSEGLLPFINPPHVALIFTPLAYLSLSNAYMVWTILQVGLLLWLLRLLSLLAVEWPAYERRMLLITAVALPSMLINFLLGAFSLLMLICTLQLVIALQRNRQIPAGLWFLVGLIKPQVMILPGVLLVASRRWRALWVIFLGGVILILVPSLILGRFTWLDYIKELREFSNFFGRYSIDPRGMYNLRGTLTLLFGDQKSILINWASMAALLGSVLFTFFLWKGSWHCEDASYELRMALTLMLGLLFSIHSFPQDGLVFIAPATLFYDYLYRRGQPHRELACIILLCPIVFLVSEFTIGGSLGIRIPVLAIFGLTIWMFIALIDRKNKPQDVHQ